jgi:hypothetical protein
VFDFGDFAADASGNTFPDHWWACPKFDSCHAPPYLGSIEIVVVP